MLPVIVIGWALIHKGARRSLILSRIIIVSLLVIALAGPYNPVTVTETDETPTITVLSDETDSMEIFDSGTAEEIFNKLQDTTPARMEKMRGLRSDIGDEILASSTGDDHIIVVSDGNNNFGSDLGETIDFVSDTGTVVYAVTQIPEENDLSVEITGARTAVLGNENSLGIEIREAGLGADCKLNIFMDGELKETRTINKFHDMKAESFPHTFYKLGPHVVTAEIISSDDMRDENNVFNKTIYVVPKPRVLLVTLDADSPLHQILKNQYNLNTASVLEANNLSDYKAVVLDNLNEGRISAAAVDDLRKYAAGGGGLLVIGGDNSYDKGDYNVSSIEAILPVESYSSEYLGSVNVVIVIDISGSLDIYDLIPYEKEVAKDLINQMGIDVNVGVVAFGGYSKQLTDGLLPLSVHNNKVSIMNNISMLKLGLRGSEMTSFDQALENADAMLENTTCEKNVVIISDGSFTNYEISSKVQNIYDSTLLKANDMTDKNIEIIFARIITNDSNTWTNVNGNKRYFFEMLADEVAGNYNGDIFKNYYELNEGDSFYLKFGQEAPDLPEDGDDAYAIVRLDEEHFITKYLNISGSLSKYNDVTQKVGARRLVTTSIGKPVVTVWEFGLGRVVSLSSDNGNIWAPVLYSGENARLLPSMVNWAVGDPRPEDGIVVYSGDMNLGSPGTVIIRSDEMPAVVFGGQDVPVSQTGERTYEGVIEPDHIGLFNLQVSAGGVTLEDTAAVNYPLEYRDVGNDLDFLEAVKRNGGEVYNVDRARSLLFSDIRKNSIMTSEEHVSLSWVFLITALLVFLGEVILRRAKGIIEIKTRRKGRTQ